jgi:hypothetical protein
VVLNTCELMPEFEEKLISNVPPAGIGAREPARLVRTFKSSCASQRGQQGKHEKHICTKEPTLLAYFVESLQACPVGAEGNVLRRILSGKKCENHNDASRC